MTLGTLRPLSSPGSQDEPTLGFGCWRVCKAALGVPSWVGMGHRVAERVWAGDGDELEMRFGELGLFSLKRGGHQGDLRAPCSA